MDLEEPSNDALPLIRGVQRHAGRRRNGMNLGRTAIRVLSFALVLVLFRFIQLAQFLRATELVLQDTEESISASMVTKGMKPPPPPSLSRAETKRVGLTTTGPKLLPSRISSSKDVTLEKSLPSISSSVKESRSGTTNTSTSEERLPPIQPMAVHNTTGTTDTWPTPAPPISTSATNTTTSHKNNTRQSISNQSTHTNASSESEDGGASSVTAFFARFGIYINSTDESTWPTLASNNQVKALRTNARLVRYEDTVNKLQTVENMARVDPLGEESFIEPNATNRLSLIPKVDYLGVLVDAGRHYFPIPWLKRLIKYLYRLRFNLLHLRLTDDQAFNVRLENYPELAVPSSTALENATYTHQKLRDLVQFAKKWNVSIVPEVNLPGHMGGWSGIANLTLLSQCPSFACTVGYGIPLNVHHPQLKRILKGVLKEIISIFDNPPFLHLGGDEVHMGERCFKEAGIAPFQYDDFEIQLEEVLQEIDYPLEQVIRWEVTGPNASLVHKRAGRIQHNWYNLPGAKLDINPNHTYFSSWHLYMDTNTDDGAEQIFYHTFNSFQTHKSGTDHIPTAIIPATFELDPNFWVQRNVAARLIAVAMGAAHLNLTQPKAIMRKYETLCREIGLHPLLCDLQGFIATTGWKYKREWKKTWQNWIQNGTCPRSGGNSRSQERRSNFMVWSEQLPEPHVGFPKVKVKISKPNDQTKH